MENGFENISRVSKQNDKEVGEGELMSFDAFQKHASKDSNIQRHP